MATTRSIPARSTRPRPPTPATSRRRHHRPRSGVKIAIAPNGVGTAATGAITVRFTLKDDCGFPVDFAGRYSVNTVIEPRFALGYFTQDAAGVVSPLTVYTKTGAAQAPNTYNPSLGQGALVENGSGAGDYTYSFPTTSTAGAAAGVAYDPGKLGETHVVWIQASRQTDEIFPTNANTFYAANRPTTSSRAGSARRSRARLSTRRTATGATTSSSPRPPPRACSTAAAAIDATFCNVCHNPGRTSNPAANSAVFVHRIHRGRKLQQANRFHGIAATYPQDLRSCDGCHRNAAQGAQAYTTVTRQACGSCHDSVKFDVSAPARRARTRPRSTPQASRSPATTWGARRPMTAPARPQPATRCSGSRTGTSRWSRRPRKTPGTGGTDNDTNAAWLAAAAFVPAGAHVITYDVKSVQLWD